jgi:hypothetical protein
LSPWTLRVRRRRRRGGIERKGKTNEDENQLWESVYIIKSPRPSLMQMRSHWQTGQGRMSKLTFSILLPNGS